MATDDDIMRRRLLIDGDGAGDDRRINNLLRNILKFCTTDTGEAEDVRNQYQKIQFALGQSRFAAEKLLAVYGMNVREQRNYDKQYKEIERKIAEAYEKIDMCKKDLNQAKRVRRNRQEYDSLAKCIDKHPDRQETTAKLAQLDSELSQHAETKQLLDGKLELRKKQLHVLVNSLNELKALLEDDDSAGLLGKDDGEDME